MESVYPAPWGRKRRLSEAIAPCDRGPTLGYIAADSVETAPVAPASRRSRELGVLSRDLVRLLRERGGRGPTHARTYWAGDDALVVLFGDCFTKAEKTLWALGAGGTAERYRSAVQEVLAAEMSRQVELTVARRVIATMSCTHFEPDLMAQIFVLETAAP